ncbi:MAG: protein kinase, partial [Gemmatimonadetes bacterium]|nr:protein kinase [Gemmatimonadota bacterium]
MTDNLDRLKTALADRYAIEHEIGAGGMATVYLAEDLKHHRKVAVKVLRPELAAAIGPERFLREIEIAAQLHHPHILPLYDSGESQGFLYYVMPYEEGQSLRDRLAREGELPITEAVRILRDVVDALSSAHEHGVVHRDIKPDNVMLSGRHALVTDFGVAKAVSEATGREKLTTVGVALGTPAYMAPEQAAAAPNIDHRADIYAVGALAYELLTGRPPFTGNTPQMILAAHVTEAPEPVTDHRPAVPPVLAQLVMRCLEKKPADRWQTTEELLAQLEGLMTTPSGGITPTDTRPIQITTRPRKKTIAIGAAGVAVLAALGGVLLRPTGTPLVDNRVMVAVFENETGDASLDAVGKIVADVLARGLQETRVVEIVDPRAAFSASSTPEGTGGVAAARGLAEQLGAATVITGEYFRLGDSLRFQAQVMETSSGRIIESLDPVAAAVENPMDGVELLNQRVMAAVAALYSPDMAGMATVLTLPTSYDAYREFITGMELISQNDWPTALRHFESGWSEDSTFAIAAIMAAFTHYFLGNPASADSIVSSLGDVRPRLMEAERHMMDWLQAILRGNNAAGFNAIRRASELSTTDVGFRWVTGYTAIDINRPRDGLQFLEELDPQARLFSGIGWLWGRIT